MLKIKIMYAAPFSKKKKKFKKMFYSENQSI